MVARHRDRPPDHGDEHPVQRHSPAHRHEPLLRQPRAAAQRARQLHRHELVPVRAPPLPARRFRGDRLPTAHRPAQELLRHPHGHGCARLPDPRHLFRRVHHPVGRRRFHARPAPPARTRPAHGDLRQRLHGGSLHRHQRRRGARGRPDRAHPQRRAAGRGSRRGARDHALGQGRGDAPRDRGRGGGGRARVGRTRAARGAGRPGAARARPREDHRHWVGRRRQLLRVAAPAAPRGHQADQRAAVSGLRPQAARRGRRGHRARGARAGSGGSRAAKPAGADRCGSSHARAGARGSTEPLRRQGQGESWACRCTGA